MSLWEEEKYNFTYEAVLKMSVWQKEQLTTTHKAVVSYPK